MALEGLHHVTAITADAQRNVDFYAGLLGLRLVKKTVNFDAPDVYHLYYGDGTGTPGSILTFFEFPDAAIGRAGAGMAHTIQWRVGSEDSIAFWQHRLTQAGVAVERDERSLHFRDPEGLSHELLAVDVDDAPLTAAADDIPVAHALRGFHGVRAYATDPARSARLLSRLGFTAEQADPAGIAGPANAGSSAPSTAGSGTRWWVVRGADRHAELRYETPPAGRGVQGAGTIHHIAWSAADDAELETFQRAALDGGAQPTPIVDRQYFHSVYFREPSGVLFEVASRDIGFDVDEPRETLGADLKLPPQYEPYRSELEQRLTPLVNPRA